MSNALDRRRPLVGQGTPLPGRSATFGCARWPPGPDPYHSRMIRKLLEKIRSLFDDGGASERMTKDRGEQQEEAEALTPGHSDRAGQIGMFS